MLLSLFKPAVIRWEIFLAVAGLLGFGYYLQYVEGLEPCPLCITQRFFLFLCGMLGLVAALHKPGVIGARVYAALGVAVAGAGSFFSIRQLHLQSLPEDQVPACGPSLEFILETFPLTEAISILLRGDGNCAEVAWTFLGLSIPAWTLVAFAGLAIGWLLQLRSQAPRI
ncbi:MAG: disulfide bond formation protein B [Gammaproteobacteria bacterium]|nr:disulfide bond formation protein B [Gammaproteobacteria bacterium]MBT8150955.1 disulfide bond formation protein B [Gammaproteobacteria bacterium]NND38310.1 disulfide bond formation protein B [Pseudomonadales bacterium]NNL11752.1 disulfide bond formation protein B [Pseudomonadales bacterium]NNM11462.1 disulfide bond formation protein B [Pseudomonadales bacterium]